MKLLKTVILALILSFSSAALADEPKVPAEVNEQSAASLEEATQDLMNRFVLAFFGKQALQVFTPYYIMDLDSEIADLYISPFPNFFKFLGYTFFIVALLAFIISLFYLFYIIYDGIFKSQKSGDFLGQSWNRLFLALKIGISLMLTIPIYSGSNGFGYNGTQYLVFYAFGKSKESSDLMIRDFSKNNPTLQPEVPMPKSYASARSMTESLLDFAMCINKNSRKVAGGKTNISIEEYVLDGNYNVMASKRSCKVILSFPLNESFSNTINADNVLSQYFENNYSIDRNLYPEGNNPYMNYASGMISSYRGLVDRMLLNSSKIMNAYMLSDRKIKHANLADALGDFEFSEFLAENRGDGNWQNLCPQFYNKISNLEKVSDFESLFIRVMGGNCLSNELMSSIVLPASDVERGRIVDNNRDFYLLCNNQNLVNNTLTEFDNTCLDTYCGSLESDFSQSYLCSYTINMFDTMRKQTSYDSLGFLVFGATIYDRFSNINPQKMKDLLNNVNITFRERASFGNIDLSRARKNNSYVSRNINLEIGNEKYIYYSSFDDKRVVAGVDYPVNIPTLIEDSSGRSINNLNTLLFRVNSCVRNPLSFQGGFVCGSVIQEINRMGLSMISIFTEYQTGKVVGNIHRKISKSSGAATAARGTFRAFQKKLLESAVVRTIIGGGVVKILSDAVSFEDDENFDHSGGGINDLFNYNNETNYATNFAVDFSNEYLRPNSVSFLGYMSGIVGFESKILSFLLYSFLLIGIFVAFFIPLIPFWLFTVAALNILSMMIIKVFSLSFMAAFIMKPSRDHNNRALNNFTSTIFEILFKIPFLVVGLISSWLLTNILISKIIIILDFENLLFINSTSVFSNSFYSLIFTTLYSIVYLFIFVKFISLTTGMIENFESLSMSLMKGQPYNFNPKDKISDLFARTRGYVYYSANIKKQMDYSRTFSENDIKNIKYEGQKIKEEIGEEVSSAKEKMVEKRDDLVAGSKGLWDKIKSRSKDEDNRDHDGVTENNQEESKKDDIINKNKEDN